MEWRLKNWSSYDSDDNKVDYIQYCVTEICMHEQHQIVKTLFAHSIETRSIKVKRKDRALHMRHVT